jgi:hypothetical protein
MVKRLTVVAGAALGIAFSLGTVAAGAAGAPTVLKFSNSPSSAVGIGFDANDPNAVPPVGSSIAIQLKLRNAVAQFGKPVGAIVGRVLLQCTVLQENSAQDEDGVCSGIAHVPNGYFTFGGNGGFTNARVNYFDITGGVGPYANDRGEIKVTNNANGSSSATVTLES